MKILVVDDEEMLVEYLQRSLSFDNHTVDTAQDGLSGFKKAVSNSYDAIILDVVMPSLSGIEICSDLRDAGIKTPVLMLSSLIDEDDRVKGLDAGADDYLIKPFGYKELTARLRALKRRASNEPAEPITIRDMTFDPANRTVERDGHSVKLRPKEQALLHCLIDNQGQAVSKAHLLHRVWGVSTGNASTRLQVCVKALRKKIDEPGNPSIIESVRGFGYIVH